MSHGFVSAFIVAAEAVVAAAVNREEEGEGEGAGMGGRELEARAEGGAVGAGE